MTVASVIMKVSDHMNAGLSLESNDQGQDKALPGIPAVSDAVEKLAGVVKDTVEEIKQGVAEFVDSTKLLPDDATAGLRDEAAHAIGQVKETVMDAVEDILQSGTRDQIRGHANQAMGQRKVAIGLAIESPELTIDGIAQKAIGLVQEFIGGAKMAEDQDTNNETASEFTSGNTSQGKHD